MFMTPCDYSEFPTSKLEMEKVADIFDKDRDGFINYKEFVSALRPDRDVSQSVYIMFLNRVRWNLSLSIVVVSAHNFIKCTQ